MSTANHGIDRVRVTFDDESLVADAGLLLVATLAAQLGLEALGNAPIAPYFVNSSLGIAWQHCGPAARAPADQRPTTRPRTASNETPAVSAITGDHPSLLPPSPQSHYTSVLQL